MTTTPELEDMQRVSEYAERYKQGCIKLSSAIDRIDYACGDPNDMEVSDYAIHQDEEQVVRRVSEKLEAMRTAMKEVYNSFTDEPASDSVWLLDDRQTAALDNLKPFLKP